MPKRHETSEVMPTRPGSRQIRVGAALVRASLRDSGTQVGIGVLFAVLAVCVYPAEAQEPRYTSIRDVDFNAYFASFAEGEGCTGPARVRAEFADLSGDGREEAVVNGYNCLVGSSGENVHAVLTLDRGGALKELPVDNIPPTYRGRATQSALVGNIGVLLRADAASLVEEVEDSSGREGPALRISFRWNGERFAVRDVAWPEFSTPSFDCRKAASSAEKTVCARADLAAMDRELAAIYRTLRAALPPAAAARLRDEQRSWLGARDACAHKWVYDCVRDAYDQRLTELKVFAGPRTPPR